MPGPNGVCYPGSGHRAVSEAVLHSSCLTPCSCTRRKLPFVLR